MRARVISTATGDQLADVALLVTIRDGRLGFSTTSAVARQLEHEPRITVAMDDRTLTGVARAVRSGAAFEEVRGRTRLAEAWLARWRRRREDVVVLVQPDEGDNGPGSTPSRPQGRTGAQ